MSFIEPLKQLNIEVSGLCNLACRMCGYAKKTLGKKVISTAMFAKVLCDAEEMGYDRLALVPVTGDIFMDRDIHKKFAMIEASSSIRSYWFFTNFILIRPETIELLSQSAKLGPQIFISIYGYDEQSFMAITQRPANQFEMLLNNLDELNKNIGSFKCTINICFYAPADFAWSPSPGNQSETRPLLKMLNSLFTSGKCRFVSNNSRFDSWGGLVTQEDVAGLNFFIRNSNETKTPKIGACSLIFSPIVLGDGRVSACSCRAVDGSLVIGHINDEPLPRIISNENKRYIDIIRRHQAGDYPSPCINCTEYRSIYRKPHRTATIPIESFLKRLSKFN